MEETAREQVELYAGEWKELNGFDVEAVQQRDLEEFFSDDPEDEPDDLERKQVAR
jgi:hypothetical protein